MNELNLKLSPQEILDKNFNFVAKGYQPEEVDSFLDDVIADENEMLRHIRRLEEENKSLINDINNLKNENRRLHMEFETVNESNDTGKFTSTNVDLLKRLSNLEKIVYGKNE